MKKTIDITSHVKVPKHIKLSEKEKEQLFSKYNISILELPRIRKTDPGIKHLSPKEGDVIKIIRNSLTSGESEYFRGVANE